MDTLTRDTLTYPGTPTTTVPFPEPAFFTVYALRMIAAEVRGRDPYWEGVISTWCALHPPSPANPVTSSHPPQGLSHPSDPPPPPHSRLTVSIIVFSRSPGRPPPHPAPLPPSRIGDDPCGDTSASLTAYHSSWVGLECRYQSDLPASAIRVVTNVHLPDRGLTGPLPASFGLLRLGLGLGLGFVHELGMQAYKHANMKA